MSFYEKWDKLNALLDFVGYPIIAVAIFDVGSYLLEEEVFRERGASFSKRSP